MWTNVAELVIRHARGDRDGACKFLICACSNSPSLKWDEGEVGCEIGVFSPQTPNTKRSQLNVVEEHLLARP